MNNNSEKQQASVEPLIDQTEAKADNERHFNLIVDGIPYRVDFSPFFFAFFKNCVSSGLYIKSKAMCFSVKKL